MHLVNTDFAGVDKVVLVKVFVFGTSLNPTVLCTAAGQHDHNTRWLHSASLCFCIKYIKAFDLMPGVDIYESIADLSTMHE